MTSVEWWPLARALHVLAVVLWIGGVAFVTLVLLPTVRDWPDTADRYALFERIEHRFANQARLTTALAGLSGFYLVYVLDAWQRFASPAWWWMHAMVLIWVLFTVMLFVLEPLVLHDWLRRRSRADPAGTLHLVIRLHRLLLALSVVTVAGAVAGTHGWSF